MDRARRIILVVVGAMLAIGTVMVYSATFVYAEKSRAVPTFFLERHAIYVACGCVALAVSSICDYHRVARWWKWSIALALLLLAAVLVPGLSVCINGARRWFSIAGMTIQPSEAAKPLLILGIAGWIVRSRENVGTFVKGFLPAMLLAGSAVALTAVEPDLGSAALLACVLGAMLFVGGVKLRYALPTALVVLPLAALAAYSRLGYIRSRLEDFMSGASDPQGAGYQINQSLTALGCGGVTGAGIGQGHCKLLYLPEAHNDFIFALIGEELGLVGTVTVILLFVIFIVMGLRVASRAPDMLGSLIALGVTLCAGLQAAINIAVVTHSMPTKGIALPFISYGGSSLVFLLAAVGMLLNVAAHPASGAANSASSAVPRPEPSLQAAAAHA
jgi:cell division protein FtsW